MSDSLIRSNIFAILSALRWQEMKDGAICYVERDNALRSILGMLNRVSKPENFTTSRSILFRMMNEAKFNIPA